MTARTRRLVAFAILVIGVGVSAPIPVEGRAATARDRYEQALVLDRDARAAAEREGETDASAVRAARRALALYESVVRRYPTSGYCDNALMRGGDLARWLFTRSGRAADKAAAAKYYAWLVREYPGSGLRAQARSAARSLDTVEPEPARHAASAQTAGGGRVATPLAPAPKTTLPAAAAVMVAAPAAAKAVAPAAVTPAAPATSAPTLRGIDRAVVNGAVRVTLLLDRETRFAHEVIDGPRRAFVDLFGAVPAADLQDAAIRYDVDAVRQVRVGRRPGATRVVLDLAGAAAVSVFTLYNPFRVVIDAERPVMAAAAMTSPTPVAPAVVVSPSPSPIAGPPAAPAVARAVVRDDVPALPRDENEIVPAVASLGSVPDGDPFEPALVVPILSGPTAGGAPSAPLFVAAPMPAPAASSAPTTVPAPPPPRRRVTSAPLTVPEADVDEQSEMVTSRAPVPSAPAVNGDGSFSLARQLGLGVSRIVIDPGHGGHDPGTLTGGTNEARLVLDVALRLEKLLQKEAGLEVVLTRRTDIFVPLEERTAIANREGADLFLSIHANSGRDTSARGIETYFLSFASNPEAESVAARENTTSASDMHRLPSIVRAIALNNKLDESRDFASMVQQSLTTRLAKTNTGMRSRGVKKAPFVVLIGAGMPSVLAEIGFITNKQEVALMKTPAYRQKVAEALHAAVLQYRRALKRQTSVAAR